MNRLNVGLQIFYVLSQSIIAKKQIQLKYFKREQV